MPQLYANNAGSTLASGINTSVTSLSVASGDGAKFPSPSAGDWFLATLATGSPESAWEIVKVTARSTDTLTIVRAQEGTTAQTWSTGDKVDLRLTGRTLDGLGIARCTTADSASQGTGTYSAGLSFPYKSGETWIVQAKLPILCTAIGTAPTITIGFQSLPTSAVGATIVQGNGSTVSSQNDEYRATITIAGSTYITALIQGVIECCFLVRGGTANGTIDLAYTVGGNATTRYTLKAGAILIAHRVDA